MPISLASLSAHTDTSSGGGRSMACRPVGLCLPERVGGGWSANRGARRTRVSEMRLFDGAASIWSDRVPAPFRTRQRGMRLGLLRSAG